MLPDKIAFVDIETTGGSPLYNRIIEIGILRIENNLLVKTFHSLINPQTFLPKEIELLTGITSSDLENAPTFRAIKDQILEIMEDCMFVAHNVRFDYGFLKSEFKRENYSFSKKHFCTVKLSRFLYPDYRHHNLDALIERFDFECKNRHRALDDATVLFHFYTKLQKDFSEEVLQSTINKCMRRPSIPLKISHEELETLPDSPGVYIFYAESGMPLYVGKSINIRDRVLSHFSSDIHSAREMSIAQQITSIETVTTTGELGALLLESRLIKKMLPLYNRISRIKHELVAIKSKLSANGYFEAYLEPITTILPDQILDNEKNFDKFLGFFKSKKQAKDHLSMIAKKYMLCEKLLGLEKTNSACFSYRLDKCNGACIEAEKADVYNLKFVTAFSETKIKPWPFNGPITISEQSHDGNMEYFLIDKWCYLGNVSVNEYGDKKDELIQELIFDLDTYKILRRFLQNPKNKNNIKPFRTSQEVALL